MMARLDGASKSQRACLRKPIHGKALTYEGSGSGVQIKNAFRCRSPLCYSCGPSRTATFANDLQRALKESESRGGSATFITLTIPTDTSIEEQRSILAEAYRSFSKEISRSLKGIKSGFSFSYDITFKKIRKDYQPHLHIHAILFAEKKIGISKEDAFKIWERSAKRAAGREIFLSPNAFYFEEMMSKEAASRYVSKFLTSSLEIANGQGKVSGLFALYEVALNDERARRVLGACLKAFFNKNWSSLGSYAGSLVPDEEEVEDQVEEGEGKQEPVLSLEVPTPVHSVLIDARLIHSFHLLMMKACREGTPEWFVARWDDFLSDFNASMKDLSYRSMEAEILKGLESYFALSLDIQKPHPERL